MKHKLSLFLCLTVCYIAAQNRTNELNIGVGYIEYKNNFTMPSGVSGTNYEIDYLHKHQLKSNTNIVFGHFANLSFSVMETWRNASYSDYMFYDNGIDAGIFWLRHLPLKNNDFNFYAGAGLFFDANILNSTFHKYNSESKEIETTNGKWLISPNIYFSGNYSLEKFSFQFSFSIPIFSVGYRTNTLFHTTVNESVKLALTPNTFCFFTERLYPKADILVSYPIFANDKTESRIQLTYTHEQLVYNGFPYERKISNGLKLGMVWMVK